MSVEWFTPTALPTLEWFGATDDMIATINKQGIGAVASVVGPTGPTGPTGPRATQNYIINGGFDVWQRGTSFTSVQDVYTADRMLYRGGANVSRSTDVPEGKGLKYSCEVSTASAPYFIQKIEGYKRFGGKTLTVSVWATEAPRLFFWYDSNGAATSISAVLIETVGAWKRYSNTFTLPYASSPAQDYLAIRVDAKLNVASKLTGWKLEEGSTATPFESRSYGEELVLCQRYYEIQPDNSTINWSGDTTNGTAYYGTSFFKVTKRVEPTVTLNNENASRFPTATVNSTVSKDFIRHVRTANSTGVNGFFGESWTADAEL